MSDWRSVQWYSFCSVSMTPWSTGQYDEMTLVAKLILLFHHSLVSFSRISRCPVNVKSCFPFQVSFWIQKYFLLKCQNQFQWDFCPSIKSVFTTTPNWKYGLKYIFESIRFWNFPTKQISVHGYLRHYSSCSLLPVEPEAVSSWWEATVFDKCIKNVKGFITIIEILTW